MIGDLWLMGNLPPGAKTNCKVTLNFEVVLGPPKAKPSRNQSGKNLKTVWINAKRLENVHFDEEGSLNSCALSSTGSPQSLRPYVLFCDEK